MKYPHNPVHHLLPPTSTWASSLGCCLKVTPLLSSLEQIRPCCNTTTCLAMLLMVLHSRCQGCCCALAGKTACNCTALLFFLSFFCSSPLDQLTHPEDIQIQLKYGSRCSDPMTTSHMQLVLASCIQNNGCPSTRPAGPAACLTQEQARTTMQPFPSNVAIACPR